jgi:hypothetical protein
VSYIDELSVIFSGSKDNGDAHVQAKPILQEMARDREFLFEIIRKNLLDPSYLSRVRHYPTLSLKIAETDRFTLVGNCWLPLPSRETDISFQSIHHHGNLELSTVSAFGSGYSSILFKKGFELESDSGIAHMEIAKDYQNTLYNLEFCESWQPHVVFYPAHFSITYALWASKESRVTDKLKKSPILQRIKTPLKVMLNATGLGKTLGIQKVENFDFHVKDRQIRTLKERVGYKAGTNKNFIQNVFYMLQEIEFKDGEFLQSLPSRLDLKIAESISPWITRLQEGTRIRDEFEEAHLQFDPHRNLNRIDVMSATGQ